MSTKYPKPVIVVDIDDVLMPHFQDLINYYNQRYGTKLTLADQHPKDAKNWGTDSLEVAIKRVQKFFKTDEFKNSKPFEEAKEVIGLLANNYTLVVVTARDRIIEKTTKIWLAQHFPGLFDDIHFTGLYSLNGDTKSKGDISASIKADFIIDDTFEHIAEAAKLGIAGLLFGDYPWNNFQKLPSNVVRVKDWQEVLNYFHL